MIFGIWLCGGYILHEEMASLSILHELAVVFFLATVSFPFMAIVIGNDNGNNRPA